MSSVQQRFHVPYTHCGCPLPGDTIGQRLSRLKRRLSSASAAPNGLIPPHRLDALSATHASEHNCVQVEQHTGFTEAERKKRAEKVRKRRERDEKAAKEGKLDVETFRRGDAHAAAFLYPVPFFAYVPLAACVAVAAAGAGAVCGGGGGTAACAVVRILIAIS